MYVLQNDYHNKLTFITSHSYKFAFLWELLRSTVLAAFKYTILLTTVIMMYITSQGFTYSCKFVTFHHLHPISPTPHLSVSMSLVFLDSTFHKWDHTVSVFDLFHLV